MTEGTENQHIRPVLVHEGGQASVRVFRQRSRCAYPATLPHSPVYAAVRASRLFGPATSPWTISRSPPQPVARYAAAASRRRAAGSSSCRSSAAAIRAPDPRRVRASASGAPDRERSSCQSVDVSAECRCVLRASTQRITRSGSTSWTLRKTPRAAVSRRAALVRISRSSAAMETAHRIEKAPTCPRGTWTPRRKRRADHRNAQPCRRVRRRTRTTRSQHRNAAR
jgi:hypothetical protein